MPVEPGDYIIEVDHWRLDYHIKVWRIHTVRPTDSGGKVAYLQEVASFSSGEWDTPEGMPPLGLEKAIIAAASKAACYHCRRPHFVKGQVRLSLDKQVQEEILCGLWIEG